MRAILVRFGYSTQAAEVDPDRHSPRFVLQGAGGGLIGVNQTIKRTMGLPSDAAF